jgi:N6-L-threonylcarbamoyladenine synthase
MKYLGIESSCDETAAAVVEVVDGRLVIRSSIVASQIETHRLYGGVVPEIASRAHIEAISRVVREALDTAGITPKELTAVGVTAHPGLIGALLCGVSFAKGLAAAYDLPLVPVDHIKAHIAAAYCKEEGEELPKPPFLALAVSGGHTSLYIAEEYMQFRTIGETRDDAIGESFDKIGRVIGIPYPAGAGFDRLAAEGFIRATGKEDVVAAYRAFKKSPYYADPAYKLPSPAMQDGTLDFSYSGLKTAAINLLHRFEQTGEPFDRAIFAAAYTYQAVEAVAKQVEEALVRYPSHALVVAGGVAANSHLRARLLGIAKRRGIALHIPPLSLCGDNGAMVAAETHFAYAAGVRAGDDLNASAADGI